MTACVAPLPMTRDHAYPFELREIDRWQGGFI
jgi:hypothetical protein